MSYHNNGVALRVAQPWETSCKETASQGKWYTCWFNSLKIESKFQPEFRFLSVCESSQWNLTLVSYGKVLGMQSLPEYVGEDVLVEATQEESHCEEWTSFPSFRTFLVIRRGTNFTTKVIR